MKHINNLLLLTAFLLSVLNCKADQLTITFINPVPAAPVNCGDTWSEQGVDMEIGCSNGNFNYGNGNLYIPNETFKINLSNLGIVNNITISILYICCIEFNYYQENNVFHNESLYPGDSFQIYEFANQNNEWIDYLELRPLDGGGTIFDITIDYTPICESEPISNVRNGDVYLNDACYGVIMTSPSGNCFRARVADDGMLFTEPITCP